MMVSPNEQVNRGSDSYASDSVAANDGLVIVDKHVWGKTRQKGRAGMRWLWYHAHGLLHGLLAALVAYLLYCNFAAEQDIKYLEQLVSEMANDADQLSTLSDEITITSYQYANGTTVEGSCVLYSNTIDCGGNRRELGSYNTLAGIHIRPHGRRFYTEMSSQGVYDDHKHNNKWYRIWIANGGGTLVGDCWGRSDCTQEAFSDTTQYDMMWIHRYNAAIKPGAVIYDFRTTWRPQKAYDTANICRIMRTIYKGVHISRLICDLAARSPRNARQYVGLKQFGS